MKEFRNQAFTVFLTSILVTIGWTADKFYSDLFFISCHFIVYFIFMIIYILAIILAFVGGVVVFSDKIKEKLHKKHS